MSKTVTYPFDVAKELRSTHEMALFLDACIDESNGDAAFIAKCLGDVARARGMTEVARLSGMSRESLYKALSGERSPDFNTILRVLEAVGLTLRVEKAKRPKARPRRTKAAAAR